MVQINGLKIVIYMLYVKTNRFCTIKPCFRIRCNIWSLNPFYDFFDSWESQSRLLDEMLFRLFISPKLLLREYTNQNCAQACCDHHFKPPDDNVALTHSCVVWSIKRQSTIFRVIIYRTKDPLSRKKTFICFLIILAYPGYTCNNVAPLIMKGFLDYYRNNIIWLIWGFFVWTILF